MTLVWWNIPVTFSTDTDRFYSQSLMNTPAHIIIGGALFSARHNSRLLIAAMFGGVLPDVSLYILAGTSLLLLNIPAQVIFNDLYFSQTWQLIFSIDNSFILWALALGISITSRSPFFISLCCSALFHLLTDFTLHNDDARAHFWPIANWRLESPLSYWDSNHHANIVAPLIGALAAIATLYLLKSRVSNWIKATLIALFFAELFVIRNWILYF